MTKKSDAPAIRFKGFSDAWEQRKLGELVDVCSGRDYKHLSEGTIPVYGTGGYMLSVNDALSYDRDAIGIGRKGTIDRPYILKAPFWTVDTLFYAIPREKADLNFAFDIFQNIDWKKKDESTGVPSLSKTAINDIDVLAPKHGEQQTIGQFFAAIDHLITLHQRQPFLHSPPDISLIVQLTPPFYTFSWEQRKLGEIGSVSMCRRIFKEQTSETGDIPFYKIGTFGADPDAFISRELFEEYKSKYPYPQKGDILISASGSIGRTVEFAGNNEYFQDSNIVWLNHDERLSNPFLKCFYSVVKWAGIEGSTIKRLYNDNILNTVICMPSVPEQKRIGLFFENLDNLITLHQRKFEKLTNVKKSMLEKMFPQNGSSYPEIRFKGFTDPWEQRKFSDITFPAGEKNKDNLPLESYSITNEHGFVPQDEKFENGGTMREADKRMYYIVSPNSFAYNPARINVGSIGYQNIGKNVIVSSLYEVFKTSEDVDDRLLWHWFKSPDFQKLIMQLQEGGVRLYFYYDKLCMGEVSLPLLEEQRKIGKLFDTLDNLITLHQRQTIVYAVIRSIRKVILAERQYFAPPMVRKFP